MSFEEELRQIVDEIKKLLSNELLCRLLDDAEKLVINENIPLRVNFFTLVFREILTKFLHLNAADDDVKACSWFVEDETSRNGITRLQRIKFFLHGGFNGEYFSDHFDIDVEGVAKDLKKKFDHLSKYVHLSEGTLDVQEEKFKSLVTESMRSFLDVLSFAYSVKIDLSQTVEAEAHDEIMSMFANETQESLDEIAQSHSIHSFYNDDVEVNFLPHCIEYHAGGTVTVEQYYGSRGDSCTILCSYPVRCVFIAEFDEPDKIEMKPNSLVVDTSSWYGAEEW